METLIQKVVAIDGPSGSGKSTLAKKLAQKLGLTYVDTGAMFRGIGLCLFRKKVSFEDIDGIEGCLKNLKFVYAESESVLIRINGEDLTQEIREHYVSDLASKVSVVKEVRAYLLDFERKLAQDKICVMEGRDIGSVVFAQAFCKFFLTASSLVRAKRRLIELERGGEKNLDLTKILKDVEERDFRDSTRGHAPLIQVRDSIFLDTSDMDIDEVLSFLEESVKMKAKEHHLSLEI